MNKGIPKVMQILEDYFNYKRRTTLNRMREKPNPYEILISCLLSLRARDENTEKISEELFKVASTPKEIVALPLPKLEKIIFSSGYYRNKAKTIKSVSQDLLDRFSGKVPKTRDELLSIKGIGPKTANIVLAFAYGEAVIPVDTHVHRIPNRLGWVKTKTPEKTEEALIKIIPKNYWTEINGLFVLFGREICQPVSPWCSKCPIKKYCKRVGVGRSR